METTATERLQRPGKEGHGKDERGILEMSGMGEKHTESGTTETCEIPETAGKVGKVGKVGKSGIPEMAAAAVMAATVATAVMTAMAAMAATAARVVMAEGGRGGMGEMAEMGGEKCARRASAEDDPLAHPKRCRSGSYLVARIEWQLVRGRWPRVQRKHFTSNVVLRRLSLSLWPSNRPGHIFKIM